MTVSDTVGRGFDSRREHQKKRHFSTKKNVFFSAKFACGEINVLMHAKSEFNLATPKELFSCCGPVTKKERVSVTYVMNTQYGRSDRT